MDRAQGLMEQFVQQNAKASAVVDEIVDLECERQENGESSGTREFDQTAEMFAIHSMIVAVADANDQ